MLRCYAFDSEEIKVLVRRGLPAPDQQTNPAAVVKTLLAFPGSHFQKVTYHKPTSDVQRVSRVLSSQRRSARNIIHKR